MPRQELEIQHGPPSLAVSLPVELLSLIFELATEGNDASSAQRVRLRLARVCKPWRATISTGSYYVANSVKAAALANSLKRSDEIVDELHVTCEERSELNPGRSKAIADLLVTCAATVKRLTVRFEAIAGTRQDPVGSPIRNALAKCKQLQSLTWNWYAAVVLDVDLPSLLTWPKLEVFRSNRLIYVFRQDYGLLDEPAFELLSSIRELASPVVVVGDDYRLLNNLRGARRLTSLHLGLVRLQNADTAVFESALSEIAPQLRQFLLAASSTDGIALSREILKKVVPSCRQLETLGIPLDIVDWAALPNILNPVASLHKLVILNMYQARYRWMYSARNPRIVPDPQSTVVDQFLLACQHLHELYLPAVVGTEAEKSATYDVARQSGIRLRVGSDDHGLFIPARS